MWNGNEITAAAALSAASNTVQAPSIHHLILAPRTMVDTSHCNLNIADVQIARLAAGFYKSPFCFIPVEIVSEDSSQVYYWVMGNWRRVADVFYFYLTGDSVAARPRWLLIVREEGW